MKKEINHKETDSKPATLNEQEAPEKNTDNAFVKVGRDGQPEIPEDSKEDNEREKGSPGQR